MSESRQNSRGTPTGSHHRPEGNGPVSRHRLVSILVLLAVAAVAVLAMFIVPFKNREGLNTVVVTTEVREIDSSLRRLAAHVEAGRHPAAQKEVTGLRRAWEGLQPGLARRGLEKSVAALAFEKGLLAVESSIGADKAMASRSSKALNAWFIEVKDGLRGTVAVEAPRLILVGGGSLLVLVTLVGTIFGLSRRLALKQ